VGFVYRRSHINAGKKLRRKNHEYGHYGEAVLTKPIQTGGCQRASAAGPAALIADADKNRGADQPYQYIAVRISRAWSGGTPTH